LGFKSEPLRIDQAVRKKEEILTDYTTQKILVFMITAVRNHKSKDIFFFC
jgi:hypothetical protein